MCIIKKNLQLNPTTSFTLLSPKLHLRWIIKTLCPSHPFSWAVLRGEVLSTNEISWRKLFTFQVPQKTVYSAAPQPNYAPPVVQKQPPKAQQQRPVSIHSFSSLQYQAPSTKPLSPLPLLQTSPQFHTSVYASPRGWAHVDSSRSPGAINQQPKTFYNTAPIEMTNSTSSYGQPQVRSRESHKAKKNNLFSISDGPWWLLKILACFLNLIGPWKNYSLFRTFFSLIIFWFCAFLKQQRAFVIDSFWMMEGWMKDRKFQSFLVKNYLKLLTKFFVKKFSKTSLFCILANLVNFCSTSIEHQSE